MLTVESSGDIPGWAIMAIRCLSKCKFYLVCDYRVLLVLSVNCTSLLSRVFELVFVVVAVHWVQGPMDVPRSFLEGCHCTLVLNKTSLALWLSTTPD